MINAWELPTSIELNNESWQIRTDYRAILDILVAFNDPEYEEDEKWIICMTILYVDFDKMPANLYQEACLKALEFIDMGAEKDTKKRPKTMDWEQDAGLIIPAVNKVLGKEVRALEYMHWWTFMGAYLEIGECSYTQVLHIRSKRAKGKPLEKWEQEFYLENKSICDLHTKLTEEELEEERRLEEKFG